MPPTIGCHHAIRQMFWQLRFVQQSVRAHRVAAQLAVPAPTVRRTVEAVLSGRPVRRGYLGVTAQPVPLPEAVRQHLGQETGLLLTHVEAKSPAEA